MPNDFYGGWGSVPPAAPNYAYEAVQREALKRSEYAQLRKHGNAVGLCLLAFFGLQYVLSVVLMIFGGGDAYRSSISFAHAVNGLFFSVIALFVPFFLLSLRKGSPRYIGVLPFSASKNRLTAVFVIFAGFGICMFSNYVAAFVSDLIQTIGLEESDIGLTVSASPLDFLLNILCTAALPALVEEFVFRGVILQPLRRYGEHFAVWSTAFVFGLAHGTVTGFAFAFLVGLVLGYAAVLTGSLWPGIIIHFLNNFYAAVVTDLSSIYPHFGAILNNIIVYIGLVFGAGALVYLVLSHSIRFEKGRAKELVKGRRFKGFFLAVPMLLSVAAFLYFILIANLK